MTRLTRRQFSAATAGLLSSAAPVSAVGAAGSRRQRPGLLSYVDPFVGVDRDGNTVPGAALPFGFAHPSPDTVPSTEFRFDTSGYRSDLPIIGFSQTHVSGTGGESKYGNFRITPQVGAPSPQDLASSKADEAAEPGYYRVSLVRPAVTAELTCTRLVALHRYTFPPTDEAQLIVDAGSVIFTGGGAGRRQRPIATTTQVVSPRHIQGSGNFIGGWNPSPYTLHFFAEFSRPFTSHGMWRNDVLLAGADQASGEQTGAGAWLTFDTRADPVVEVRIGLSFVSSDKARRNIAAEIGSSSFDEVRGAAAQAWEEVLGKIVVDGGSPDERRIFYTALYRSHYAPHDLSGENAWWASEEPHYEDYCAIWDTFRTVHPLLTLIQPERQRDMLRSLVDIYRHTGWMPDSRVAGANGMMQGGTHADVLIADAMVKGLEGIDYETAYRAMVKNAEVESPRPAYEGRELGDYASRGYLTTRTERSASRTVEYAFNDFCLATVAKGLGKTDDHRRYLARSRNWANLWDSETASIRPREPDGRWMTPFDKTRLYMLQGPQFTWMSAPYYEGSAYQYSTFVPHDVAGLIERLGGDEAFVRWLDVFFGALPSDEGLRAEGLYTHVNEPDLLAPYLYIHAGRPDRTQERVRQIMRREYRTGRDGLPGNDDSGTMSAWYVWNAIGLYPNAGHDYYYIGSPIFERTLIDVGGGRSFAIEAPGVSERNRHVRAASLDGAALHRAWLRHSEIVGGGRLVLQMTARATRWGRSQRPPS